MTTAGLEARVRVRVRWPRWPRWRRAARATAAGLLAALVVAACAATDVAPPEDLRPQGGPRRPGDAEGPYPVVDVVDGDTIKVDVDGERVTVRIIGIDTPETEDPRKPVQCFGWEATERAQALLGDGPVWLSADPTQDDVDRYGRRLAHVWLPDATLFEWAMVAGGYAHQYTYDVPDEHHDALVDAERRARDAGLGLWSPTTCAGDTTRAAP